MMRGNGWMAVALCVGSLIAAPVGATTMTANLTVDNSFNLYISTDDTVTGTFVTSGSSWGTTYTGTATLTPGVTNYIHVQASDSGSPQSFIGQFTLSDAGFKFANDTQTLLTKPSEWKLSFVGFGQSYQPSITSWGLNGMSPWGTRTGISASAEYLNFTGSSSSNYFSAEIIPVPEPSSAAFLGLIVVGLRRWRS